MAVFSEIQVRSHNSLISKPIVLCCVVFVLCTQNTNVHMRSTSALLIAQVTENVLQIFLRAFVDGSPGSSGSPAKIIRSPEKFLLAEKNKLALI